MKDIYYRLQNTQETIEGLVDNVKEDRTDLDLLYQVLINWGLPLDLRHDMEEIDGFTIHIVDTDALIACLSRIFLKVMRKIAGNQTSRIQGRIVQEQPRQTQYRGDLQDDCTGHKVTGNLRLRRP